MENSVTRDEDEEDGDNDLCRNFPLLLVAAAGLRLLCAAACNCRVFAAENFGIGFAIDKIIETEK